MRFVVDAQLPYGLTRMLKSKGCDCIHTDDMPQKERTTDHEIRTIALNENRIVITKDADFVDSYYVQHQPRQLLIITTGNIKNKQLFELFSKNFSRLEKIFANHSFIEMNKHEIIVHE